MLITNKAQYTCDKTLIWLRLSLTCCTYVLGGRTTIFSFDKSTSLEGGQNKNPEMIRGGFKKWKHTDKKDVFSKIQYYLAVLSNKVSQGTQIIWWISCFHFHVIRVYSSWLFSSSNWIGEFVHAVPLHWPHVGEHSSPCLRQVHVALAQSDEQLQLIICRSDPLTGGSVDWASQAVTREVMSSTPARPTLRVFKQLNRKCCLCNYISKWLNFQVFSDKDYKP